MTGRVPPDVARLLEERAAARAARDWDAADALRDRIRGQGWEPVDTASGSTARPSAPPATAELGSLLDEPASVDASVVVVADDHPEDLVRLLHGLAAHPPTVAWELLVVANAPALAIEPLLDEAWPGDASLPRPTVLASEARLGWADAVNLGLRRSRGAVTILLDSSLAPVGEVFGPLLAGFDDAKVGVAGGWGVTTTDAREFVEAPPGRVHAVEAYFLAIRREALRAVGGFDPGYRFYRNADLDFSFAVRDAGWQAVRTQPLPFERHPHRGWEAQPAAERDRLSKRNFYRFLKRWRDRPDLVAPLS
ncbi:MAG TPA: glycosyltransferase [Methylomirabilota bacterium]|nr:glycosyltransferase [Methylomirabilota bacterium]